MEITEAFIRKRLAECYRKDDYDGKEVIENNSNTSNNETLKCAAVLLPLVYYHSEWSIVFTRRTDHVENHKGQVAFPGGGCEEHEKQPEQTALRETWEEIGVNSGNIRILGRMNDIITITNFKVTPVVGIIPWMEPFTLSMEEVSRVFKIPIDWLIQINNWEEQEFFREGNKLLVIKYQPYDGDVLWGATARITQNFLRILNLI